jgi:hypothetical protein
MPLTPLFPHHSTGSALQTYNITSSGHITPSQTFTYTLSGPGTVPNRQDAPHPHEAILDPTQQYVLITDLGADLVHVYAVDQKTNLLTAKTPLKAKAGSGPRHGAFTLDTIAGHYVFYLGAEIASTVTAYRVTYADAVGGMTFDEIGVYSTLAPGQAVPATTTGESTGVAAEVAVSVSVAVVAAFFLSWSLHLCRFLVAWCARCTERHVLRKIASRAWALPQTRRAASFASVFLLSQRMLVSTPLMINSPMARHSSSQIVAT